MNTNINENGNSQIPEVEDLVIEDGDDAETIKAKTTEWKAKMEDRNKQLFARAKKAEGFEEDSDGKWIKKQAETKKKPDADETSKDNLSSMDVMALMQNNVTHTDDIEEVVEYAKLKKMSIKDALNAGIVKKILADNAEARKIADGTHTGASTRTTGKVSDDVLLSNAKKGQMPENEEDLARLVKLRKGLK